MRWLEGITDSMDMNMSKLRLMVKDRGAWLAAVHGVTKRHDLATEQQQHCPQHPRKGPVFLGKNREGTAHPLAWVSEGKIT